MKETKHPLISIIVPVYNVEEYLPRCVESILAQTYKNLEIILVDDGSTDHSGEICDAYRGKDARIRVIHKKNGGLSDARNAGLDIMTGEYVACIDSDDFVSPFFISNLWIALDKSESDMASSWFVEYYNGDIVPSAQEVELAKVKELSREKYFEKLLYQDGVEISAWGKLYKSEYYQNVRYPVGKLYEDVSTTYLLIEKAQKIAVISNVDYYYFQRKNSIAQTEFSMRKMDAINNMRIFGAFIEEKYPNLMDAFECRYFNTVCNILFQIDEPEFEKAKKDLWNDVKRCRFDVLRNANARLKSRLAATVSYGGYHIMKKIYQWNENRSR